jgi:hypothetical protein
MVYDSVSQRVVLFEGITCCSSAVTGDTWTWDGTDWTQQIPATTPPENNAYSTGAFDSVQGVTVRFDDYLQSGLWRPSTWTWNGANWSNLAPAHSPSARILDAALAFDPIAQQVLLFGGSDSSEDSILAWKTTPTHGRGTEPTGPSKRRPRRLTAASTMPWCTTQDARRCCCSAA